MAAGLKRQVDAALVQERIVAMLPDRSVRSRCCCQR
jgi:hypothetical protein